MVDLPAPDGPTIATVLPAGTLNEMSCRNFSFFVIVKPDIPEFDFPFFDFNRLGIGFVLDFLFNDHEREHFFQISETLADFTIDKADKIEWDKKLYQQRIDHNEIAEGLLACGNRIRRHDHACCHADAHDDRLPHVKPGQRRPDLDRSGFVACHGLPEAAGLKRFVAEIFHGLEVKQRIDRFGICLRVIFVHVAANADPPIGCFDGEPNVRGDHQHHHEHIAEIEPYPDDNRHQRKFQE